MGVQSRSSEFTLKSIEVTFAPLRSASKDKYPVDGPKLITFLFLKSRLPKIFPISSRQSKTPSVNPSIPGISIMWYHSQSSNEMLSEGGKPH